MSYKIEPIEDGRLRLTISDDTQITDIIEGPMRWIMNTLLGKLEPGTRLGIRTVRSSRPDATQPPQ